MNVGFIGLGIMGRPMAGHLLKGGHSLSVFDHSKAPEELTAGGAKACASGMEVAANSDVVITMVPDTPHVEAALFGEGGVAEGLSPGKIVVDMSSISPIATKDFARRITELGCEYLDPPVSGGDVGAKAASLTIMVGGRRLPSTRSSRCSSSWARTSPMSVATVTARQLKLPTRSSSP